MTKKRIVILTCLLQLGIGLGYLFSNYLNERATYSYEWTSNPIIIWAMAIPSILCMVALVVIGYFIGKKYDKEVL